MPQTLDAPAHPLDKRPEAIRAMFGRVAPAYDLLNHLLSASLDRHWRRRLARSLDRVSANGTRPAGGSSAAALAAAAPADRGLDDLPALDLCCGTGDQAMAMQREGARVAAADFCLPMVALARRKFSRLAAGRPAPLVGDALALPFPSGAFRAASVSFGLRNVADLDASLRELRRVVAPGGQLLVLELAVPPWTPLRALYLFYFRRLLPLIGRMVSGDPSAYSYLPGSVLEFPQREGFVERMAAAGFAAGGWDDLAAGIVCLYSGRAV
jgi:demethylmenaquinone methyltransferase/2-methoxy-6-polyprenyl-1,4-benzoquinol methylase